MDQNPYDELGLDPSMSPAELTEKLQRLAERLPPEERDRVRAIWQRLTMHEAERLKLAFFAHPRGAHSSAEPLETLRQRVAPPPKPELEPIEARLVDALLDFKQNTDSKRRPIPRELQPDAAFSAILDEALGAPAPLSATFNPGTSAQNTSDDR